jgi:glycerol-3-phosphate acyltransferase PlsX
MIKIAVDAMGGDFAPKEQVEGAMLAIQKIPDIEINLYGDEIEVAKFLTNKERITVIGSHYVIPMGETNPVKAIKEHPDSSMSMALASLRKGQNDAAVCSGATQALITGAHLLVRRMAGFRRTAIAPTIPSFNGKGTILLDCGANLEIRPEHMLQQAFFAVVYAKEALGRENPVVGLINIGTEEGKGRELEKTVYDLFKATKLFTFCGNVETKEILNPPCDILIADGYTADIVMKTIEGTAKGMGELLKRELKRTFLGKLGALIARKNLKSFKKAMSAEEIGGAVIFGLYAPVIKAQGASHAYGFSNAIRQAANVVRNNVYPKVAKYVQESGVQFGNEE